MFTGMQFSSVKTAMEIVKAENVGKFSPLPFVSLLVNCIIWTFYGILTKDLTVLIPNANGILAGLFGVATFHKYARFVPHKLYFTGMAIVAWVFKLFRDKNSRGIGYMGCCLAIILSGSPLATLGTVVRDKSTAALPFLNSFTTWLNALLWALYGSLVSKDIMVYGPNSLGFILASLQMAMYAIYGLPPK